MKDEILSYSINPQLWITSVSVTMFVIIAILVIGYFIPEKYKNHLTLFLGFLFFARFVFLHGYMVGIGHWDIHNSLPLHLCGINSIICIVLMFKFNQSLYEYLVLLGVPSAFHSILTPQFINGWDGYYFPEFYLSHVIIFLAPLYLTIVNGHSLRFNSWKNSFIYGLVTVAIIGIINLVISFFTGTLPNYMYTCVAPEADNPLIMTKKWPNYYIILTTFTFAHILIVFYLFKLFGKVKK